MQRVLITGGSGDIAQAFINRYSCLYEFHILGRNEANLVSAAADHKYLCDICNLHDLKQIFRKVQPSIVIHTAAVKHVNLAEQQPTFCVDVNVKGSLNVIESSIESSVPLTIATSTDKACNPQNTYGYSKKLMEELFREAHSPSNCFVTTRFANVALSRGSVIPYWLLQKEHGEKLKLTSPDMCRLMFSLYEAAGVIGYAIQSSLNNWKTAIYTKKMKYVNMLELAKVISNEIEIVGSRPGEKLHENLITTDEVKRTDVDSEGFITLYPKPVLGLNNLSEEYSTHTAGRMSWEEMKELIYDV